ncbi:MAG: hypothetical protein IVW55_04545 [Chloroflexi bacterium]|nr:hypothetical protein [Chloroflexota bacterium]
MSVRLTGSEFRVFFRDPDTNFVRSIPAAWTDQATPDPFIHLAAGRACLRLSDLHSSVQLLLALEKSLPRPQHTANIDSDGDDLPTPASWPTGSWQV